MKMYLNTSWLGTFLVVKQDKTIPYNVAGMGSIPDQRAKIPPLEVKKQSRNNIVTNLMKTLKMVHIKKNH